MPPANFPQLYSIGNVGQLERMDVALEWDGDARGIVFMKEPPDKRHIYSKRTFYLDEDSWTALASDQYDARGQLYRSSFAFQSQSYDVQAPFDTTFAIYDFTSGAYNITGLFGSYDGLKYMTELPRDSAWTADALAGAGVR